MGGLAPPVLRHPGHPHSNFTFVNQVGWFGSILSLSVILAWVYNNTGSVLLAMVLHAMANTADMVIPLAADAILVDGVVSDRAVATVVIVHLAVYVLVALGLVAAYGRQKLAHGEIPVTDYVGG